MIHWHENLKVCTYIVEHTYTGIVRADHLRLEHENDIIPITVT